MAAPQACPVTDDWARGVSSKMAEGEEGGALQDGRLDSWRGWREDYGAPGGAAEVMILKDSVQCPLEILSRPSGYLRGKGVLVGASEGEEGTSVSF